MKVITASTIGNLISAHIEGYKNEPQVTLD